MTTGHSRACVTHASLTPCYDIDTLYPPDVKKKKKGRKKEEKRKSEKEKRKKEKDTIRAEVCGRQGVALCHPGADAASLDAPGVTNPAI